MTYLKMLAEENLRHLPEADKSNYNEKCITQQDIMLIILFLPNIYAAKTNK